MGYIEQNKILGEHPTRSMVNVYFPAAMLIHAGISYLLPKYYRTLWQAGSIGFELAVVKHNYDVGIRVRF